MVQKHTVCILWYRFDISMSNTMHWHATCQCIILKLFSLFNTKSHLYPFNCECSIPSNLFLILQMQNSSLETISSVTTKPLDPYQPWSFHKYECSSCVSFSIILVEFKGTELRLTRHVLASAPTCLWCKWLHSSVWHTNSIMHLRASLLLLPETTC